MGNLLATLAAVIISLASISGFALMSRNATNSIKNSVAAGINVTFNKAVQQYVQDFGPNIAATASPNAPVQITIDMLRNSGYLPSGFSGKNPWRQTWQAEVLQPTPGQLITLVTSTGGREISDPAQLVQIAALTGAQGGYIPYDKMLGDSNLSPNTAVGAFGAWTQPMAGFSNPGAGHLASLLAFSGIETNNGFLYRIAVPGRPELNAMQTNLSMTDQGGTKHNIAGAQDVGTVSVTASGSISAANGRFQVDTSGRIGTNGFAPSTLPFGWGGGISTFDMYAQGSVALGSNGSTTVYLNRDGSIRGAAGKFNVETNGVLSLGVVGSSGAACSLQSNEAAITVDSAGVPLTCLRGIWTPIGGRMQTRGFYDAVDGTVISDPGCPNTATPLLRIIPKNIYINPTASASYYSPPGNPPWVIQIRDGANQPISGAAAQVESFCAYN